MSQALIGNYSSGYFLVENTKPFTLKIGESSPELDALLTEHNVTTWASLTAYNPGGIESSIEANQNRLEVLQTEVTAAGYPIFHGENFPQSNEASSEPSLLILGITEEQCILLGKKYGQIAIVYGELGIPAKLCYC